MKGSDPTEYLESIERMQRFQDSLRRFTERREARRSARADATRKRRIKTARPPVGHGELREAWYRAPLAQQCEVCLEKPADDAHHVVKQQVLRRCASDYGYDFEVVRWDRRNRMWVCRGCHEHHTDASRRIHVSILRPDILEFIEEYGFGWAIEREYDRRDWVPVEKVA